ncbi:MAG: hypothetical protein HFJ06_07920 [Lachnospiraceae bacterium]|nr:hypothetical protein [Lachnospiraceae bacterium]
MEEKRGRKEYEIIQIRKWFIRHQLAVKLLIWLLASFFGLFSIYEILDYFKVNFIYIFLNPIIIFICISIIVTLIRAIVYLIQNIPSSLSNSTNEYIDDKDSLIEMLKDAESHSRWTEIIKIGSALSDVLWFTSRKKLRVAIGHFVEVAATQIDDKYTLSTTLIEDLGNTIMGLGKVDEGIKYIERGIEVAEECNFYFLIMRGYRNLANCYSLKGDSTKATVYLTNAEAATNNIADEIKKYEALGAIEYARCKVYKTDKRYDDAIKALDDSISSYKKLSNKYPETEKRNNDRLVKIYREKGAIYLAMNTENSIDRAYDSLTAGLKLARETMNYENIIKCCNMLAKILIDKNAIDAAEGMMNIAKECINKIDTPSIVNEYNEVIRKLEFEKYAV